MPAKDYIEYGFDVSDNMSSDIYVIAESVPETLSLYLQSDNTQNTWRWALLRFLNTAKFTEDLPFFFFFCRGISPLIIRAYDPTRASGQYKLRVDNLGSEDVRMKLHVELRVAVGMAPEDSFNVVYFVSFFFLFLFSFLFVAIIVRKIRDIINYNRMRDEYLKARASRIIPPLFGVQMLNENQQIRLLTPDISPVVSLFLIFLPSNERNLTCVCAPCSLWPLSTSMGRKSPWRPSHFCLWDHSRRTKET